jgi:hypothetical protein
LSSEPRSSEGSSQFPQLGSNSGQKHKNKVKCLSGSIMRCLEESSILKYHFIYFLNNVSLFKASIQTFLKGYTHICMCARARAHTHTHTLLCCLWENKNNLHDINIKLLFKKC